MTLPYYEVHEGDGPPLLLVHGILSSRAQWLPNLDALKEACSPVVLELLGHGRSPAPREAGPYQPAAYIEAFETIREHLGVKRWYVCGYSLGAGLTIRYSIQCPGSVIAQVFTNSTSAFAERQTTDRYREDGESLIERFEEGGMEAVESIPVHPKFASRLPEAIKSALMADCQLLNPGGVARTIVHTNGNSSVRDIVHTNTVPALLICGDREARFGPLKQHVMANMPDLEVVDLPAGHAVNAEEPAGFNRAMLAFLGKHG